MPRERHWYGQSMPGNAIDGRVQYVLSSIAVLSQCSQGNLSHLEDDKAMHQFLDNPTCPLLKAGVVKNEAGDVLEVHLSNEQITPRSADEKTRLFEIHFIKQAAEALSVANIATFVQVMSVVQSPIQSLYQSLHNVYAPQILKKEAWSKTMETKVKDLVDDLDKRLGDSIMNNVAGGGRDSFFGIMKPTDEIQYWKDNRRGKMRDAATKFSEGLSPLAKVFGKMEALKNPSDAMPAHEMIDFLDEVLDGLDSVWKADVQLQLAYSQSRMVNFMGLIGGTIGQYVHLTVAEIDVLKEPYSHVRKPIRDALAIVEKWTTIVYDLTYTYWGPTSGEEHVWEGPPHKDSYVEGLGQRINEVWRIKSTTQQLSQMLNEDEKKQMAESVFEPFKGISPLQYSPFTKERWDESVAKHEKKLAVFEQMVAEQLLKFVQRLDSKPTLLLHELVRYSQLLQRPLILQRLGSEMQSLLTQCSSYLERLEGDYDTQSSKLARMSAGSENKNVPSGRCMSLRVNVVIWFKQISSRVSDMLKDAKEVLGKLQDFDAFEHGCTSFKSKLELAVKTQVQEWEEDVRNKIADRALKTEMSGQLLNINKEGILIVNYSERLVVLLREVRQLGDLGFSIHSDIRNVTNEGEKYYRHGVLLKKVANFYNTMERQIIPEMKPMLLESLLAFEDVVKNPRVRGRASGSGHDAAVSWSNPEECQEYVEKLQGAAERLSAENRRLRNLHKKLGDYVLALMTIDRVKQRTQWKAKYEELTGEITTLKRSYREKGMSTWLLYWDHQLYKALESGYQIGLESLNENLADIKCDLVFVQKQLQFRPPIEELRAGYYKEMKKFIAIPSNFNGVGNNVAVFQKMADRNVGCLYKVYEKAEDLFTRLVEMKDSLTHWVVLGTVDLDAFVEENVRDVPDWELNFNMLKSKRKEVEKLPDYTKVDCVTVGLAPLKNVIESHMQYLSDALILSLRKSINVHLKVVEDFLDASMTLLNTRPHSITELGDAQQQWKQIDLDKAAVKVEWDKCEEKRNLLVTVVSSGMSVDMSDFQAKLSTIPSRWEDFEIALEAFNEMVEEQKQHLKVELEQQVKEAEAQLKRFADRWHALKPGAEMKSWDAKSIEDVFTALSDWREQFEAVNHECGELLTNCECFQMAPPTFEMRKIVEEGLGKVEATWNHLKEYRQELQALRDQDWVSFRSHLFDLQDVNTKWVEKMKTIEDRNSPVIDYIAKENAKIKKAMPTLKFCRGEPFKEEHWSALFKKLGMPKGLSLQALTCGHFLDVLDALSAPDCLQFVKTLQARAQGEVTIREALQELKAWTETAEVKLQEHEELGRRTPLIKEWKDLFLELGDNQSLLQSLKESQFFKPFADQAATYERNMANLDTYLHHLNQIQRKWVYLEPIFGRGALPSEQGRFRRVDDEYRDIMSNVEREPLLFNLADESVFPQMGDRLQMMVDQLERCQKALADYLEEKRSRMPRFYFIGDDDMLEILGQAKNPLVIQSHLKKLFQALYKVGFSPDNTKIIEMYSSYGEKVDLKKPVVITDAVEEWLDDLSAEMNNTLECLMVECFKQVCSDKVEYEHFPSQILDKSEELKFVKDCERAIGEGAKALVDVQNELTGKLTEYTSLDLSSQPLMQLKVKALVLDLVHMIDVVSQLQKARVQSTSEWIWQKQLRFYLEGQKCVIRMNDATFAYTCEYQGNAGKLVHTPLTDKCYLTLTQGMHMGFGGNPYGPAGTGKTESVKALGNAFGRQVLVFNCDEGIDFQSMGRIFTGLVKCGAWGCFDEFNRLKEDQLSAVSQQIQIIQDAIKEKNPSITLLGKPVNVDFNAGIFVTLNPAGKGYGGRSNLPDNLKALFRPIAMGRPDNNLIAEVILYSEGFLMAKDLASKIVSLFTLSKELLSSQQHYDWGLRALKAVLNTGGKMIQQSRRDQGQLSTSQEAEVLIKAVRVNTLSKLTFSDSTRFIDLIGDVFPGVKSEDISIPELEAAIKDVMTHKPFGLNEDDTQVKKMLQLKESLDQRMGCVIVGPSGCGKSTVWRVLQNAMIKCGTQVKIYVMNPKSMPRERLLGSMDMDTRDWTDGVLTDAARQVVKEPQEIRSWIVCDGDVDPEWIESLNSVLDDNHLLTMPNGERISFGSNVNFLFETHDLKWASPATISRMGMIFLSDEDIDIRRVVEKWLKETSDKDKRDVLTSFCDQFFYKAVDEVLRYKFVVDTTKVGTVLNGLSHCKSAQTEGDFIFGLIQGLGGNLDTSDRTEFAKTLLQWSKERIPDVNAPLGCLCKDGIWTKYETKAYKQDFGSMTIGRTELLGDFVIPTISVQRTSDMIRPWVENMEPFILVGPEGAGKSMVINSVFRASKSTSITTLHCNAQTNAENVIQKIHQSCSLFSTNSGRVYRPRDSERLVLYLKDINLPKPDQYDTCMLIAFLQQLITFQGFYDENLEFLGLERVQIVASMNAATTVGRHVLSTRFTAIVRIGYVDYPSTSELTEVYTTYLEALANSFPGIEPQWATTASRTKLASTMMDLYEQVRDKFSVDEHRHYLFTPRDLTAWVRGLLRYDIGNPSPR